MPLYRKYICPNCSEEHKTPTITIYQKNGDHGVIIVNKVGTPERHVGSYMANPLIGSLRKLHLRKKIAAIMLPLKKEILL